MILNLTERTSERLFVIGGGAGGSIIGWITIDIPNLFLSMNLHEWMEFLLTIAVGSIVGWGIHAGLNWIRKECKPHKKHKK